MTIDQKPSTLKRFMAQAERMRQKAVNSGDQSDGAVVVKDGKIVGLGPSRVVTSNDPTAHAEMEAIRDAGRHLGTTDLSGCLLISTSRACAMCETAAHWARIEHMYFSHSVHSAGKPKYRRC